MKISSVFLDKLYTPETVHNSRYCNNVHSTCGVWDANVHLTVETAKPSQSWVNAVGSVGSCHDNDMGPLLQPIHQS